MARYAGVRRHLDEVLDHLQRALPPKYPVQLHVYPFARGRDCHAEFFQRNGRRFEIHIDERVLRDRGRAVELLIHEWAHCLEYTNLKDYERGLREGEPEHGPAFGLAYAQAYSAWYDED